MSSSRVESRADLRPTEALTGLRFFAAAWVVIFHVAEGFELIFPSLRALRPLTSSGYLGVQVFFVLSGFVIAYNYLGRLRTWDSSASKHFLWLRFVRIYPLHLVTLLFLVVLKVVAEAAGREILPKSGVRSFFEQLLLLAAWPGSDHLSWNYPAYSISAEFFAYALFPLFAGTLFDIGRKRMNAVVAFAVCIAVLGVALAFGIQSPLVHVACGFAAGVFLERIYRTVRPHEAWSGISTGVVVLLVVNLWVFDGTVRLLLATILFSLLILSLPLGPGRLSRFLSRRSVLFLGEASYALYMTHGIIHGLLANIVPFEDFEDASLAAKAVVTLIYIGTLSCTAVACHFLVERPARARLRKVQVGRPLPHDETASATSVGAPVSGEPGLDAGEVQAPPARTGSSAVVANDVDLPAGTVRVDPS